LEQDPGQDAWRRGGMRRCLRSANMKVATIMSTFNSPWPRDGRENLDKKVAIVSAS
jgi:hypothetical protein